MRERRVDLERLLRLLHLLLLAQVLDRAHVVEPVGELDQDHAHVLRHRDDHLAVVLGLGLLAALELDPRQLRHALDELRDLVAELGAHFLDVGVGVLDHVVEQRGGDRLLVEVELGADLRGAPRVVDEVLARAALLALVRGRGEGEGPREQVAVDVRVVGSDGLDQLVDELLMPFCRLEDRHRKSVLRAFPVAVARVIPRAGGKSFGSNHGPRAQTTTGAKGRAAGAHAGRARRTRVRAAALAAAARSARAAQCRGRPSSVLT